MMDETKHSCTEEVPYDNDKSKDYRSNVINERPNATAGLWLSCLLPLSYMVNTWKYSTIGIQYKLCTIIGFGLFLQTLLIFAELFWKFPKVIKFNKYLVILLTSFTAFLIWICLKQDIYFSALLGFSSNILYRFLYFSIVEKLPRSFTLGEASIVVQGICLFLLNAFITFTNFKVNNSSISNMQEISIILQIALLGLTSLVIITHFVEVFRKMWLFSMLTLTIILLGMFFTINNQFAVVILMAFIFENQQRISIMLIYIGLVGLSGSIVFWYNSKNEESATTITNTRTRKLFHILIVCVCVPGLLYECTFLFMSSVIMLALFIYLETVRLIEFPIVSEILKKTTKTFTDEKDSGPIILTPIYLLCGCVMPIWLHPHPCDLTDSAGFELLTLLSGVLTVGIGDTAASFFGSIFGKHKWECGHKSIEGTVASIICQALAIGTLNDIGFITLNKYKIIMSTIAVIFTALIEAKTDQIDNLVLPLIMFIILSI